MTPTDDSINPGARRDWLRRNPSLIQKLEQRARLAPGGSADHPVVLTSASLVDVRAESTPCPLCQGNLRLVDHVVEHGASGPLRVAHVRCFICGTPRALYFRIAERRAS